MHLKQFKGQLNSLEELDIYIYAYASCSFYNVGSYSMNWLTYRIKDINSNQDYCCHKSIWTLNYSPKLRLDLKI